MCVCLLVSLVETLRVLIWFKFDIGLSFVNDIFWAFLIYRSLRDHPKSVLHGDSLKSMT